MEKTKQEILKKYFREGKGRLSQTDLFKAMDEYADQFRPAPSVKASEAINFYEIETDLREYFTKNRDGKGSGYAIRLLKALAGTQWKEGQRADLIETAFKEGYARRNSQHYSRDWAEFKEKYLTGKEADQAVKFLDWYLKSPYCPLNAPGEDNEFIDEAHPNDPTVTTEQLYSLFQNK